MQRTTVNTNRTQAQEDFALRVKVALLHRGESLSDLARRLGLSRNTISLAVNRGLYEPTRRRIRQDLKL